jgi:hypothetical protein
MFAYLLWSHRHWIPLVKRGLDSISKTRTDSISETRTGLY